MELPSSCVVTRGSASLFRVTIPANLYSSSIDVEVEGIDVRLRLLDDGEENSNRRPRSRHSRGAPSRNHTHAPNEDSQFPFLSSTHLAESYLETQGQEEKEELEDMILSQSHTSPSAPTAESDVSHDGGTGLPGFLAMFFQGVIDRLRVNLRKINLRVDTNVPSGRTVSALFMASEVAVGSTSPPPGQSSLEADAPGSQAGKKPVVVSGIQATLMSDHEAFGPAPPPPQHPQDRAFLADPFGSRAGSSREDPRVIPGLVDVVGSESPTRPDRRRDALPRELNLDNVSHLLDLSGNDSDSDSDSHFCSPDNFGEEMAQSKALSAEEPDMFRSAVSRPPDDDSSSSSASSSPHVPGAWVSTSMYGPPDSDDEEDNLDDGATMTEEGDALEEGTRTSKRLLDIPTITVWLPSLSAAEGSTGAGTGPNIEGSSTPRAATQRWEAGPPDDLRRQRASSSADADNIPTTDVKIPSVEVSFDISCIWLLSQFVDRLAKQVPSTSRPHHQRKREFTRRSAINLSLRECSCTFYDRQRPTTSHEPEQSHLLDFEQNVLFQMMLHDINWRRSVDNGGSQSRLAINDVALGFDDEKMITINRGSNSGPAGQVRSHDAIVVNSNQSLYSTEINLKTLPVLVTLNLPRLNHAVNQMDAVMSPIISQLSTDVPSHHDHTHRSSTPSTASQQVINIRAQLGKVNLDLINEQCNIKLQTSPLHVASHPHGVKVTIERFKLSGPHVSRQHALATIKICDFSLNFSYTPGEDDLDRLVSLVAPSHDKYDSGDDGGDIMLDDLLRQRKKAPFLDLAFGEMRTTLTDLTAFDLLHSVATDANKLGRVTQYLPEDDGPGLLTFVHVDDASVQTEVPGDFGKVDVSVIDADVAHVGLPSLIASRVQLAGARRNGDEELIGEAVTSSALRRILENSNGQAPPIPPMLRAKFVADEAKPEVKIKFHNTRLEYSVRTLLAVMSVGSQDSAAAPDTADVTAEDIAVDLTKSVLDLTDSPPLPQRTERDITKNSLPPLRYSLVFQDCIVGLNTINAPAKGLVVLNDARFLGSLNGDKEYIQHEDENGSSRSVAKIEVQNAAVMVIDDTKNTKDIRSLRKSHISSRSSRSHLVHKTLVRLGYVSTCSVSSGSAVVKAVQHDDLPGDSKDRRSLDVELSKSVIVLESCADSTQTLLDVLSGLLPPRRNDDTAMFRTEAVPLRDILKSLEEEALKSSGTPTASDGQNEAGSVANPMDDSLLSDYVIPTVEDYDSVDFVDDFKPSKSKRDRHGSFASHASSSSSISEDEMVTDVQSLRINEDFFSNLPTLNSRAHLFDTSRQKFTYVSNSDLSKCPLQIRVLDATVIWNLFDGYDWHATREKISKAVIEKVQTKAAERRARFGSGSRGSSFSDELRPTFTDLDEDEDDVLFNSVRVDIPAQRDAHNVFDDINRNIQGVTPTFTDSVSDANSQIATRSNFTTATTLNASSSRRSSITSLMTPAHAPKLRLGRSRRRKLAFDLRGISLDFIMYPPEVSRESQSSLDLRIRDLDVLDYVPTSTWSKFATYNRDAGERETGSDMIRVRLVNVKPVPELAATEIVLKAAVLPLRLHVDQDALDFATRFFSFKNDDNAPGENSDTEDTNDETTEPFFQLVEIDEIPVRLDFKPKRVDYSGLRAGSTTEFMNFIILEEADMILQHIIVDSGISGVETLAMTLKEAWMPDITRNQLHTVLAGLAPIKGMVGVGSGFRDLILVPVREYQKDGRVVRSVSKGAKSFAKTTTNELVKFGAKLAIGTQSILQSAETFLNDPAGVQQQQQQNEQHQQETWPSSSSTQPAGPSSSSSGSAQNNDGLEHLRDIAIDANERTQISLYANQPMTFIQGLQGGYSGLSRDLNIARDALVAVPADIMESSTPGQIAQALLRHAPTVMLRPAIGASKVVGQTLLGAGNVLDKRNRRRMEDVSFYSP